MLYRVVAQQFKSHVRYRSHLQTHESECRAMQRQLLACLKVGNTCWSVHSARGSTFEFSFQSSASCRE